MENTFGERLKKIREEKGLSQQDLADILGTSKQVISRYENNLRVPKLTVAIEYAVKLGVPRERLLDNTWTGENKKPDIKDDELSLLKRDFINLVDSATEEDVVAARAYIQGRIDARKNQ